MIDLLEGREIEIDQETKRKDNVVLMMKNGKKTEVEIPYES